MVVALSILVFLTIAVVVFSLGAATVVPASVLGARLREIGWQRPKGEEKSVRERMQQALGPLSRALPVSATGVSKTRDWLIQAGYRSPQHATIYRGLRVLFAGLGFAGVVLVTGMDSPLLLAGMPAFGYFIPRFLLKRAVKARQRRIRLALPDALDLTVICVEAGLPLDQAMLRVGEDLAYAHPELSAEFHMVNLETRAGKPRVEALRNLAARGDASVAELRVNGAVIAAQVLMYCGNTAYTWKTAFDAAYAKYSPGALLVDRITEQLLASPGLSAINSCAVEASFMGQLWSGRRAMADVLIDIGGEKSLAYYVEALRLVGYQRLRHWRDVVRQRAA